MSTNFNDLSININNLGAVKNAEVNLKPLTVFVGENGTGKTYTAYLIAYIFSKYSWEKISQTISNKKRTIFFDEIEEVTNELYRIGKSTIDLKKFIKDNTKKYYSYLCNDIIPEGFKSFLASDGDFLNNIQVNLSLRNSEETQYSHLSSHFLDFSFKCKEQCNECNIGTCLINSKKIKYFINNDNLIIDFEKIDEKVSKKNIRIFVSNLILQLLHRSVFNEVYLLGAERTGLSLLFNSVRKKETNNKAKEKKKKGNRINHSHTNSSPTSALLSISHAMFNPEIKKIRQDKLKSEENIQKYLKLSEILEQTILGGNHKIKEDEELGIKRIIFDYLEGDTKIPLNMATSSSSVKGLSSLVFLLRYMIEPNEIIVIDEPEMNLHPKAQVQLIELLAMLANSGVYVIITTHSPYIIDHLINLVKGSNKGNQELLSKNFYLKDSSAFISKENLSAYLFENNSVSNIFSKDGEIKWNTFSNVSEQITELFFEMDN